VAFKSFGYDLSAATDRLPIALQQVILDTWLGQGFGVAWRKLLVDRDYILTQDGVSERIRYSVGQPMGALSSWAMLAVTHHFLVQYCAQLAGKRLPGDWYDNYELLGDDIILFDEEVARQYLLLMEGIGVPINLSKSVVARNNTIEFAKVTVTADQNVSALSWKMFISQNTMMGRANIAFSLLRKDICNDHLVKWVMSFTAKSRKEVGDIRYTLFALLSMAANSKMLELRKVLSLGFPKKDAKVHHVGQYYNLLKNLSIPLMIRVFTKTFSADRGNLRIFWEDKSALYRTFLRGFVHLLFEKISHYYVEVDRFRGFFARTQAREVLSIVWPQVPKQSLEPILPDNGRSVSDHVWNAWVIHQYLIQLFDIKYKMDPPLESINSNLNWIELSTLVEDLSRIDRCLELNTIQDRIKRVGIDESKPEVKESPLKYLSLMIKGVKRGSRLTGPWQLIPTRRNRRKSQKSTFGANGPSTMNHG
jgi:hypothetical protein